MRVEPFSTGYYLTELYVESGEEKPRINDHSYRGLQYEVHDPGDDEQGILFQMDGALFAVEPSKEVPIDTLAVPQGMIEHTTIRNPPTRREIMVPKPWTFQFLKDPDMQRGEAL